MLPPIEFTSSEAKLFSFRIITPKRKWILHLSRIFNVQNLGGSLIWAWTGLGLTMHEMYILLG